MKKFWIVYTMKNSGVFTRCETKEDAVNEAKRQQALDPHNSFWVLESVAVTVKPVPQIEVQELT